MTVTKSASEASIDHVSEEERIRHERFLQAVKQLLIKGAHQEKAARPRQYASGTYATLLSPEELQFLLR